MCHAGECARGAGRVDAAVFGLLHHGGLASCSSAGGWGPARPGAAHGHRDAAHHGPGPSAGLRRLSPRPQPGTLVLSCPLAHRLLLLLVAAFVPTGPVVVGVDDTIERRWGAKIKA